MNKITLFEEYRLIEKSETEVNGAWKGVHLLLFFSAFIFGSVCTFCFHMLMYLFDEQCVLFPKLLSLTSSHHNVIYEFIPENKQLKDLLPVDFLCTQWVDKSTCYLPTYVPLVSGIFGLVWTTMFLMCNTGSRSLTGLQRPWRVMFPVFVFSLAMGGLCIHTSIVTHKGLQDLCVKLGEITGISNSCEYSVNVATLAYERRIHGVYQATRMTILAAWMHTGCWLLSAIVALLRVAFVVDFHLVRINVDLIGDIDKMLEQHEEQIRTVSPSVWFDDESSKDIFRAPSVVLSDGETNTRTQDQPEDTLFISQYLPSHNSKLSLVPEEKYKLQRLEAYQSVPKDKRFIIKMLNDLIDGLNIESSSEDGQRIPRRTKITSTTKKRGSIGYEPSETATTAMESTNEQDMASESIRSEMKKSNLKSNKYVQTGKSKKTEKKVVISEAADDDSESDHDKETQTPEKEKQD